MRSVFLGLALAALGVALSCAKAHPDTFTVVLPSTMFTEAMLV